MRFQNDNYDKDKGIQEGRIVDESTMVWNPISTNLAMRSETVIKIRISDLVLQDSRGIHLDEATEDTITMFTTVNDAIRPYNQKDAAHVSFMIERDMDKYKIERTVYTSLDWLGDVGGLMDILFVIGTFPIILL